MKKLLYLMSGLMLLTGLVYGMDFDHDETLFEEDILVEIIQPKKILSEEIAIDPEKKFWELSDSLKTYSDENLNGVNRLIEINEKISSLSKKEVEKAQSLGLWGKWNDRKSLANFKIKRLKEEKSKLSPALTQQKIIEDILEKKKEEEEENLQNFKKKLKMGLEQKVTAQELQQYLEEQKNRLDKLKEYKFDVSDDEDKALVGHIGEIEIRLADERKKEEEITKKILGQSSPLLLTDKPHWEGQAIKPTALPQRHFQKSDFSKKVQSTEKSHASLIKKHAPGKRAGKIAVGTAVSLVAIAGAATITQNLYIDRVLKKMGVNPRRITGAQRGLMVYALWAGLAHRLPVWAQKRMPKKIDYVRAFKQKLLDAALTPKLFNYPRSAEILKQLSGIDPKKVNPQFFR